MRVGSPGMGLGPLEKGPQRASAHPTPQLPPCPIQAEVCHWEEVPYPAVLAL